MKNMKEQMEEYRRSRRFRNRWTKLLGAMACVVVFCTVYALILPAITLERKDAATSSSAVLAGTYSVALHEDPSAVDTRQVDLEQDAHVELWAEGSADSWQWQIWSAESGSWFDIYGDDGQSCDLYYAKVKNMLRGSGAKLRAVATIDGVEWVSDTVAVSVRAFSAGAEETEDAEPVILSLGSEPLGDVSGMADGEKSTSSSVKTESIKEKETEATTEAPAETDELGSSAADESEKASEEEEVGTDETESGVSDESEDASEDGKLGTDEAESDASDGSEDASEDEKAGADESSEIGEDSEKEENGVDESADTGKDGEKEENEVNESSGVDEDGEEEVKGADESSETDKDSEEEEDGETEDLADSFAEDAEEDADETDEEDGDSESGVKSRSAAAASVRGSRKATGSNANRVVVIAEYDENAGDGEPGEGTGESSGEDTPSVDVTKKYTVRVYYQYENKTTVTAPWSATFAYTGETGEYQVEFPTIRGYKVKDVTVDVKEIEPNLVLRVGDDENNENSPSIIGLRLPETISSDVNYYVTYEPDKVSYRVKHYLQNLDDPLTYTEQEDDEEIKTALADSLLRNDAKSYTGFVMRPYQYPTAAADGTTVVDIYYDREYYKIDFELDGGEGVSGIYVPYGSSLAGLLKLADPVKPGYTFGGWYTDENLSEGPINPVVDFPKVMPAKNIIYYAKWLGSQAVYSVTVWVEGLTAGEYHYLTSTELSASTGALVGSSTGDVQNYLASLLDEKNTELYQTELKYFTLNEGASDTNVTVNGDGSSMVNVYYTRNSYTLRFVYARQAGNTYYMSSSNHGYSLHQYDSKVGMTGDSLTEGCNWTNLGGNVRFTLNSKFNDTSWYSTGTFQEDNSTFYYVDLTAKYGEDISSYWPQAGSVVSSTGRSVIDWGTHYDSLYRKTYAADGSDHAEPNIHPYYGTMDKYLIVDAGKTSEGGVPTHILVAYTSDATIYTWEYTYYYEAFQSQIADSTVTKAEKSVTVDGEKKSIQFVKGDTVTVTTTQTDHGISYVSVVGINGFVTPSDGAGTLELGGNYGTGGNANPNNPYVLNLYYVRERYSITFHNGYWGTKVASGIPYGENLSGYAADLRAGFDNPNDSSLSDHWTENNVTLTNVTPLSATQADENFERKWKFGDKWFEAWNAGLNTGVGAEIDLSGLTMPQNDLILYPAWEPVEYTATFYWQNVQTGILEKAPGVKEDGIAVDIDGKEMIETFHYGDGLQYREVEYGQYEFLHWSYFVFLEDWEDPSGTMHVAGEAIHAYDGTDYDQYYAQITELLLAGTIQEQRLDFDTAVFTSDVNVFGTWNEKVYVDYTVHYVLLDADKVETEDIDKVVIDHFREVDGEMVAFDENNERIGVQIAADTEDSRYAGINVTVTAKVGNELYENYQGTDDEGLACYPVGASTHSLEMDITQSNLEYTFFYKRGNPVTYRVEHLTAVLDEEGKVVKDPDTGEVQYEAIEVNKVEYVWEINTTQAIVTADFEDIPGYTLMADPATGKMDYQITRVLTHADPRKDADGNVILDENGNIVGSEITEANTIRFYYRLQNTGEEYTVEYYFQQMDGTYLNRPEYSQNLKAPVGTLQTAEIRNYVGYWHDPEAEGSKLTGEVVDPEENGEGLVLKVYYNAYPVVITKEWESSIEADERKAVTMHVYKAEMQTDNSYLAEEYVDNSISQGFVLDDGNNWTYTVYLPYLEKLITDPSGGKEDIIVPLEDQCYVIWEEDSLEKGYLASYNDAMEVFIKSGEGEPNIRSTVGKAELTKSASADNPDEVTVTNAPAEELPNTGGTGTMPYTIGGLIFMTGAAMCGLVQRRKRERRAKN